MTKETYQAKPPIAVMHLCSFGGIEILDTDDTHVIAVMTHRSKRSKADRYPIQTGASGKKYFQIRDSRYYLDDFMRLA